MTNDGHEEMAVAIVEEPVAPATLFHTDDPTEIVSKASAMATALADVITSKGLITKISGRDYVRVEGWTLLGSMVGVFGIPVWTRPLDDGGGWEARVEARTLSGAIVGAAEAECTRDENNWKDRDSYALRSMAQTRATAKALRLPLGFIVAMAGYEATPAEEMPNGANKPPVETTTEVIDGEVIEFIKDPDGVPWKPVECPTHHLAWASFRNGQNGYWTSCNVKGEGRGFNARGYCVQRPQPLTAVERDALRLDQEHAAITA